MRGHHQKARMGRRGRRRRRGGKGPRRRSRCCGWGMSGLPAQNCSSRRPILVGARGVTHLTHRRYQPNRPAGDYRLCHLADAPGAAGHVLGAHRHRGRARQHRGSGRAIVSWQTDHANSFRERDLRALCPDDYDIGIYEVFEYVSPTSSAMCTPTSADAQTGIRPIPGRSSAHIPRKLPPDLPRHARRVPRARLVHLPPQVRRAGVQCRATRVQPRRRAGGRGGAGAAVCVGVGQHTRQGEQEAE